MSAAGALAGLAGVLGACGGDVGAVPIAEWGLPACEAPGLPGVGLLRLVEGAALQRRAGGPGCEQVIALAEANELLASCGGVLHRSTDAGCSWTVLDEGCSYRRLIVRPGGGAFGLCTSSADDESRVTRLAGGVVDPVAAPARDGRDLLTDGFEPERLLLVTDEGAVFRSDDGGDTWRRQTELPSEVTAQPLVAVAPGDVRRLVMADGARMWRTLDGGSTFEQLIVEVRGVPYDAVATRALLWAPGEAVLALAVPRGDDGEPVVDADGVYRSEDAGRTFVWERASADAVSLELGPGGAGHYLLLVVGGDTTGAVEVVAGEEAMALPIDAAPAAAVFSPADAGLVYLGLR